MAKEKHIGKCALCGNVCELTYEHIPPRAAFNSKPIKGYNVFDFVKESDRKPWDTNGLKYTNLQKGTGLYSLCSNCNSLTGALYGDEYRRFALFASEFLKKHPDDFNSSINFEHFHPHRFIKQVLSMFCSINPYVEISKEMKELLDENNSYDFQGLIGTLIDSRISSFKSKLIIDELRPFVLDKNATGLDKSKFKLCMYLTRSEINKQLGIQCMINTQNNTFQNVSEIIANPLGFLLYINPSDNLEAKGVDITSFADLKYDDEMELTLPFVFFNSNSVFPSDFRSKEEIEGTIEQNHKVFNEL